MKMLTASPLAEGRELKYKRQENNTQNGRSPLAEGRELKFADALQLGEESRVAPRGGA